MSEVQSDTQDQVNSQPADAQPSSSEPVAEPAAEAAQAAPEQAAEPAAEPAPEQPPVDNAHVAEGCEQFAEPGHPALGPLQRIEDLAIQWGGDVMAQVRQLVGEARNLL